MKMAADEQNAMQRIDRNTIAIEKLATLLIKAQTPAGMKTKEREQKECAGAAPYDSHLSCHRDIDDFFDVRSGHDWIICISRDEREHRDIDEQRGEQHKETRSRRTYSS
jgi:hypothetical protein